MAKRAMLIDYQYCTGCHSCEVSCKKEKELKGDEWGISVKEYGPVMFPDGKWEWDFIPAPSRLCDLCEQRASEGKVPLCELHCLAAVIKVVPIEKISEQLADMDKGKVAVFIP